MKLGSFPDRCYFIAAENGFAYSDHDIGRIYDYINVVINVHALRTVRLKHMTRITIVLYNYRFSCSV